MFETDVKLLVSVLVFTGRFVLSDTSGSDSSNASRAANSSPEREFSSIDFDSSNSNASSSVGPVL